jgi:hypothetical protein
MKYDVVIVGAGPAGIFTAIEMLRHGSKKKILIIEKGKAIENRACPKTKTKKCMNCQPYCHITTGFSGAGAFSDGKLSLSYEVGGDLPSLIGADLAQDTIDYTDKIYLEFGADTHIEGLENTDEVKAIRKPSFVFLYGYEADGCTISGEGTIDANGHAFVQRKDQYYVTGDFYPRPTVIYVEKSNHITFKDITIVDAPFWTLHPAGCDDVLIDRIRILNDLDVANSDGIDPDHCSNVRILGCHVECADDCICLKASKGNAEYGPCENIVIDGCTLVSTSAAIKIGTEGVGDFRNVLVQNCVISRSNRGLSIQIRDGGSVENVSYSNIIIETRRFCPDWWGTAEPITITAFDRDQNTRCGKVKNIRFFNITAKGENGVLLHGTAENPIEDVRFENCRITLTKTSKWPCGLYDLRPCLDYGVEKYQNAAFFLRHAKDITIEKTKTDWGNLCPDYSCAVDAAYVDNLELIRLTGHAADPAEDDLKLRHVRLVK